MHTIFILITVGRYPTEFQLINVVFLLPNVDYVCLDEEAQNQTNHCPCSNPEYDQTAVISSVTTEWNLICESQPLASLAQSMMQVGILAGSLIYGFISDRYGRKLAVLLALFTEALFVTVSAFTPTFWIFMGCRFLIGTGVGGTMLCCYVLLIELSGKSFKPYLVGLIEISFISAYVILPIIAFYVREWRHLQMITAVPWLLAIVYYWLIPESPRWLITMGKKKEAIQLLTCIAKKNSMPTQDIEAVVNQIQEESKANDSQKTGSYLDLFKTSKIRRYTITTSFIWLFCNHTFFGVNQYIGRLQGNVYLNVALSAVSLAPAILLVVVAALYIRRKVSVVTCFSIAALSLLVLIFIPKDMSSITLTFAIISQIGAYSAFVFVYLYSSEIFPTVVRNSALGLASTFSRIGGFIAPFVVNLGTEWVSILIFSALAFLAAILCCLLPETKDTVLLNSIQQVEKGNKNVPCEQN